MPTTYENQLKQTEHLAVGLVHVQLGYANLEWPTSTTGHQSFQVLVALTPKGPVWEGATGYFPFLVHWSYWETVVVPVLQDETNQFTPDNGAEENWLLLSQLNVKNYAGLVRYFQDKLIGQMKTVGLLPTDPDDTQVYAAQAPGEPVTRDPEVSQTEADIEAAGGTSYRRYDTDGELSLYQKFDD